MDRTPSALLDAGADRVWVDHKGSARLERAELFTNGLRKGDTLLLLARADLGVGKEVPRFEALAAQIGAEIEVVEPAAPPGRLKPGPKPKLDPTADQMARCLHYWRGPWKRSEAMRQISEVVGFDVTASQCNRALGPRNPTKEADMADIHELISKLRSCKNQDWRLDDLVNNTIGQVRKVTTLGLNGRGSMERYFGPKANLSGLGSSVPSPTKTPESRSRAIKALEKKLAEST